MESVLRSSEEKPRQPKVNQSARVRTRHGLVSCVCEKLGNGPLEVKPLEEALPWDPESPPHINQKESYLTTRRSPALTSHVRTRQKHPIPKLHAHLRGL